MLFNEPKLLKSLKDVELLFAIRVSVLFNEPKLLKTVSDVRCAGRWPVSVLFNEPKLLKTQPLFHYPKERTKSFSALQRAEIAEIAWSTTRFCSTKLVSVLFNEPKLLKVGDAPRRPAAPDVSVLFNEPKLLKHRRRPLERTGGRFQCSSTSRNC